MIKSSREVQDIHRSFVLINEIYYQIVLRQFQMRLYWAYSNQPRIDNKISVGNQDMCFRAEGDNNALLLYDVSNLYSSSNNKLGLFINSNTFNRL